MWFQYTNFIRYFNMGSEVPSSFNVKHCYEFNITEMNNIFISFVPFSISFLPKSTSKFHNKIYQWNQHKISDWMIQVSVSENNNYWKSISGIILISRDIVNTSLLRHVSTYLFSTRLYCLQETNRLPSIS